jgi:hypothetical protein
MQGCGWDVDMHAVNAGYNSDTRFGDGVIYANRGQQGGLQNLNDDTDGIIKHREH